MSNIRYTKIPLNQVNMWSPEIEDPNFCQTLFGDLGYIFHIYYRDKDFSIFKKNKSLIENKFLDVLIENKPVPVFFHKLEKILILKKYWDTHNKWRDPIVVTWVGEKDGLDQFTTHPGRDRLHLMKVMEIKEYNFLRIDHDDLNDKNFQEIKQHWGEYAGKLYIGPTVENQNRFVLNNMDGRELYSTFENFKDWLKQ